MDPLELELHKVVINRMGARNWIRVFCKAVSALTHCATSPALLSLIFSKYLIFSNCFLLANKNWGICVYNLLCLIFMKSSNSHEKNSKKCNVSFSEKHQGGLLVLASSPGWSSGFPLPGEEHLWVTQDPAPLTAPLRSQPPSELCFYSHCYMLLWAPQCSVFFSGLWHSNDHDLLCSSSCPSTGHCRLFQVGSASFWYISRLLWSTALSSGFTVFWSSPGPDCLFKGPWLQTVMFSKPRSEHSGCLLTGVLLQVAPSAIPLACASLHVSIHTWKPGV